jgi:hypothetical protein
MARYLQAIELWPLGRHLAERQPARVRPLCGVVAVGRCCCWIWPSHAISTRLWPTCPACGYTAWTPSRRAPRPTATDAGPKCVVSRRWSKPKRSRLAAGSARQAAPTIRRVRAAAERRRQTELALATRGLSVRERAAVDRATRAVLNALLHGPTVALRHGDEAQGEPLIQALECDRHQA